VHLAPAVKWGKQEGGDKMDMDFKINIDKAAIENKVK
jgi:hypothetical protein